MESYILLCGEVGYWGVLVEATEGREDSFKGGRPNNIWEKPEGGHMACSPGTLLETTLSSPSFVCPRMLNAF